MSFFNRLNPKCFSSLIFCSMYIRYPGNSTKVLKLYGTGKNPQNSWNTVFGVNMVHFWTCYESFTCKQYALKHPSLGVMTYSPGEEFPGIFVK